MLTSKAKPAVYKTTRKLSNLKDCPYCKSQLTETEKEFFPCSCTFQACVDCYKDIMKNKAVCPICHAHLKLGGLNAIHVSKREELSKTEIDKPPAKKVEKKTTTTTTITVVTTVSGKGSSHSEKTSSSTTHYHEEISRATLNKMSFQELSKLRIIQKNMVYVIGLAPEMARADILEKFEYFGQYGKITKTIVNKSNAYNVHGPGGPSYSAYISFSNDIEASIAILAVDEVEIYDRLIRASYGTTKYCTFFLRDKACPNSSCLYLHAVGKEKDSFIKDESISNRDIFNDQQRLALEHIQKHYNEILQKINSNIKGKTLLPAVKTIQGRLAEFMAEYERLKASTKAKEVVKAPTKTSLQDTSKVNTEENSSKQEKEKEDIKEGENKENKPGNESTQANTEKKEGITKLDTETLQSRQTSLKNQTSLEEASPTEENNGNKIEAKSEPACQSHRSSCSNQSTTANSVKRESNIDQKEEMEAKLSLKSGESITKDSESSTKPEETLVENQTNEESKGNINLFDLLEKIEVKEANDIYQDEMDRKIIENLFGNLNTQSSSRFKLVQGDDKDDFDETKTNEEGSDNWDDQNEEFDVIFKSIQEYITSPTLHPLGEADEHSSNLNSEESSFWTLSKNMMQDCPNFSTPTKKTHATANGSSNYGQKGSSSLNSGSTQANSASGEDSDKSKLSGRKVKYTSNDNIEEDFKEVNNKSKSKGNKKNISNNIAATNNIKEDNKNPNILINSNQRFNISKNYGHSPIQTIL